MARPTKLTPDLCDRICQRLRAGVPDIYAAEGNGIDRSTFWQWLELGRKAEDCDLAGCIDLHHGPTTGELSYVEFVDRVTVAEADAVALAMSYVAKAMPKDPANARWWLERRHPTSFKPRTEVAAKLATAAGAGGPVPFEIIIVPHDRPQKELDAFARGGS